MYYTYKRFKTCFISELILIIELISFADCSRYFNLYLKNYTLYRM
ncbi:hypothetical protein BCAH1134_C0463 (plasmid) [Bacillus cereus AH1134]|nr:hypothetical protein BCAH1134_C0463 [Bacillus cereus AH1134]